MRRAVAALILCAAFSAALDAQSLSSDAAALPADRIADLLGLLPGVGQLDDGDLSVRGAGRGTTALYLDGVPITPGQRSLGSAVLGGSWHGATGSGAAVGTNAFGSLELRAGPELAEFGNGRGGSVRIGLRPVETGNRNLGVRAGWATDEVLGSSQRLGFNRLTFEADARTGRLTLMTAATLEGQQSARLGLEQNASPVYLAGGVDTTVTVNGPGGATDVDVLQFRRSAGLRIPASASTNYTVAGRAAYTVGSGQELSLSILASQAQARVFDYASLYVNTNQRADRRWSRAVTGGWRGKVLDRPGLTLHGEAALSWQSDQATASPLSTAAEADSRSPWGGFLVSPLDFRFDASSFPVNEALVRNFRLNSGRLSPYDLNNPTQYAVVDQFRNNAYGVTGFGDYGGPVGRLTLAAEDRLVAKVAAEARVGERHRVRAGVEAVRYDLDYYSSQLTTQAGAEAYVESPSRKALFVDYALPLSAITLGAGLRYDHFRSNASRPDFPRISTAPGFDPANPTAGFTADEGHGQLSPSLHASFAAGPRLTLRGGVGRRAAVPDFALLLAGINSDLSVTNGSQVYGTDLGFERSTMGELGARYLLTRSITVDGAVWTRSDDDVVEQRLRTEFDAFTQSQRDIQRYLNGGKRSATGLDLTLRAALGARGRAWMSYGLVDATTTTRTNFPTAAETDINFEQVRPHTLAGALLYETGEGSGRLGGILRNTGVFVTARIASGTAYTRCPAFNPNDVSRLSGSGCSASIVGEANGSRLPALKLVDLRVTRRIALGGAGLTIFADARNLLNSRNVTRVFSQTGKVTNALEREVVLASDLEGFASEAARNGVLLADSTLDLSFGGVPDPRSACGAWQADDGSSAVPNCAYLLGAEERFGNGDHLFTIAEQTRAATALYMVGRGLAQFTGSGRRVRLGLEVRW